jgi:hypothetical protein
MRLLPCAALSAIGLLASGQLQGVELLADADTWVHGAPSYTSQNYGGGEFLKVRAHGPRIALIHFDTESLPAGAELGATLSLHVSRVVVPGVVQVRPVLEPFREDAVTFETRPMLGPDVIGILNLAPTDSGQRVEVDVSALVASWIADPASNFGLALTADGSTADIHFGSRNAGTSPGLVVAVANAVTVSHDGGDYSDPVTAAQQAFSGDAWCVNPTADAPCTINIDEGVYVLNETLDLPERVAVRGAGKTATLLVAASGVDVAVVAWGAVEDLSVINRQDSSIARAVGLRAVGDASLSRVAVRAEGAIDNVGLEISANFSIVLDEADVTAVGGNNAVAIDLNTGGGNIEANSSRISAIGALLENEGISKFFDVGGSVVLTDTTVVASGGTRAAGIAISDEEGGHVTVIGGLVGASASERAIGIAGGEYSEDLVVEDARILVDAPEAVGIGWGGVMDVSISVANVLVDSTDVAVSWSVESTETSNSVEIVASQLVGGRRALDIDTRDFIGLTVEVRDSLLRGNESIGSAGGEHQVAVKNGILDGDISLQEPAVLTCTDVLGGDYQPLGSDCLPQ